MQKFHVGDLVQIAKNLGSCMSHFTNDARAIVLGSYRDEHGGGKGGEQDYSLFIEDRGFSAWYYEHQLTLIKTKQIELLTLWREKYNEEEEDDEDSTFIG